MKILGLHFGHDAGVALVEDGKVRFLAHSERIIGKKKAHGLSHSLLTKIFDRAGLRIDEIDYCTITTTQGMDIVLDDRHPFSIEIAQHPTNKIPSVMGDAQHDLANIPVSKLRPLFDPVSTSRHGIARHERRVRHVIEELGIPIENVVALPSFNRGLLDAKSTLGRKSKLQSLADGNFPAHAELKALVPEFNFPATLVFEGRRIPAVFINHHAAHAASTFYQSPHHTSAIMTLDGGANFFEGGMFWLGTGKDIVPLRVHYLELGRLYLHMAHSVLKLGGSAEGKMMGLAPYGSPVLFDPRFVGNACDDASGAGFSELWVKHVTEQLAALPGYVLDDLGNPDKMTTPVNADVAASTQKLFEETMLAAVSQLMKILKATGVTTDVLSLSGGCMLNCPTNSRISQESAFRTVHVEPACDDGGLPGGSALWLYHNILGHEREIIDPVKAGLPYQGLPQNPNDVEAALALHGNDIIVSQPKDVAGEAAQRLVAGQVVGWFEGRSEIGPRALGHRSIVADPRSMETWQRVNTIKGRELWRPLAPSVLAEYAAEWFSGLPEASPFMMFVGTVTGPGVPAIAHVDGTARVQTVSQECGGYYDLITKFRALTGCAVVLNTSMNGPGEPIAEYPADAVKMLLDGRFDCLVVEGRLVERRKAH